MDSLQECTRRLESGPNTFSPPQTIFCSFVLHPPTLPSSFLLPFRTRGQWGYSTMDMDDQDHSAINTHPPTVCTVFRLYSSQTRTRAGVFVKTIFEPGRTCKALLYAALDHPTPFHSRENQQPAPSPTEHISSSIGYLIPTAPSILPQSLVYTFFFFWVPAVLDKTLAPSHHTFQRDPTTSQPISHLQTALIQGSNRLSTRPIVSQGLQGRGEQAWIRGIAINTINMALLSLCNTR